MRREFAVKIRLVAALSDDNCGQGWANYKFFLLFLWYSSALGLYVALISLLELMNFVVAGPDVPLS
jgi:hypothetical protein